jgi:hypothetical protein
MRESAQYLSLSKSQITLTVTLCLSFNHSIVYKQSMKFRRLKVSEKDVLLPFAVMFSSNLLLLLLWTVLDPIFWNRVIVSDTESYGTCNVSKKNAWKSILIVLGLVNGTALVLANVEAYKARQITTEYGESKYIAMIMASILQIVIVGLPLMFLIDGNPAASYFIESSIIFVICMSTLTLIFIPKIITWRNKKDARKLSPTVAPGLRFQVYDSPELIAERAVKLEEYGLKVAALEQLMKERGYETSALFKEVGLDNISSVKPSRYQPYALTSVSREKALSSVVSDSEGTILTSEKKTSSETAVASAFRTLEGEEEKSPNLNNKNAAEGAAPDDEGINDILSEPLCDGISSSLNGDGAEPDLEGNHDFASTNVPPPVL